MAETRHVFVHIGAPKTGTTYLQQVLHANRAQLAERGVLYPDTGLDAHHTAAWALRPKDKSGFDARRFGGHWEQVVEQVDAWQGPTAVISSEMFVFFAPALTRKVVDGFQDAEVHVIYTARDLERQVPAVWQEQVKNKQTESFRDFVTDLLGPRNTQLGRHFWRAQDAPEALARWTTHLDPARVHIVTAPTAGSPPGELWNRFAGVIGVDGRDYDAEIPPANTSLGVTAAEVLRRYNAKHAEGLPLGKYRKTVTRPLMPALVEGIRDDARLSIDSSQRRLLVHRCEQIATELGKVGYDVVGSLDELVPEASPRVDRSSSQRGPDDLSDAEIADALIDVVHRLLVTERKGSKRRRKRRRRTRGPGAQA